MSLNPPPSFLLLDNKAAIYLSSFSHSNALTFLFMADGIPIVYYGMEQGFTGGSDPANREALWPSGYANSTGVQIITTLNNLRNWMIKMDAGQTPTSKQDTLDIIGTNTLQIGEGAKNKAPSGSLEMIKRMDEGYEWQNNERLYKKGSQDRPEPLRSPITKRDASVANTSFIESPASVTGATTQVMSIVRGGVIGVVTNIGSPVSATRYSQLEWIANSYLFNSLRT